MSDGKEKLMDPAHNDLIPSDDGPAIAAPELSPDYEEKPRPGAGSGIDWISEELPRTKAEPCGFDDGLQLRRASDGGLHVYKNNLIVRDIAELEPDELRTIKRYLERSL